MSATSHPATVVTAESLGRIAEGVEAQTGHGGAVEAHPNVQGAVILPTGVTASADPTPDTAAPAPAPAAPATVVNVNPPK